MAVLLTNNGVSLLASSIAAGATSITVQVGEGARFPSPSGGDWFPVTLLKASGQFEICRCTARSGDVLTVTRAQEGTTALSFSTGDRVELRLTDGALALFVQEGEYGVGTIGTATSDLDAIVSTGWYKARAAAVGIPLASILGYNVHYQGDASFGTMVAVSYDNGALFARVRQSGAWGVWKRQIGGNTITTNDFDAITETNFYNNSSGSAVGIPLAGRIFSLTHININANTAMQFAVDIFDSTLDQRSFIRTKSAGAWSAWDEIFTSSGPNLITKDTGSIGFGTGSGSTVTQATSKATGVTLNKPSGQITMNAASLAADTAVSFTLTNSAIGANDIVNVEIKSGAATGGSYQVQCDQKAAGSCRISLRNMTTGALAEALVLQFEVRKGAIA